VLAVAILSPIDEWAPRLFWVHMLQHLLLVYLAAPLLVVAAPLLLPEHALRRSGIGWLPSPLGAFGLSTAVLWLWHFPVLYELALDDDVVHAVEHLTFLGAFGLYWWVLTNPGSGNGRRTLYLLAGATQAMLLGGLIMLSDGVLYTHYLHAPYAGSLSSLADQQLGGALMLLPGPVVYGLAAALVLCDD